MRTLVTILLVLLVLAALGVIGIYAGFWDVAADQPHAGITHWALDTAKERAVRDAAEDIVVPSLTEPAMLELGAHEFREMCETCHGGPGAEPSVIGQGLNPEPPDLAEEADEWEPAEIFWIVKHGIKMTGMPAFGPTHDEEELWSIVAFVERLPELSPVEYEGYAERGAAAGGGHHDGEMADGHEHSGETGSAPEAGDAVGESGHAHPEGDHPHPEPPAEPDTEAPEQPPPA